MIPMKRTALTLILITAILFSSGGRMTTLEVAKAFLPAPAIIIYSPVDNGISTNTSIPLSVGVNILKNSPDIVRILYSVDDNANVTLTNLTRTDNFWFDPNRVGSEFRVSSSLENLAEGNHTLTVYSQDAEGREMSSSVKFTVDTHYKYPEAIILSPQNKTYASNEVLLSWTCDEKILSANYFLDDPLYGATQLSGNTTLAELLNGTHTITVYVFTERGQATSQTVHFTVSPEAQFQAEPFQTLLVIAVVVTAVALVAVTVYWKKRKRNNEPR